MYCSAQDVHQALPEHTVRTLLVDAPQHDPDHRVIMSAIRAASAEIDAALAVVLPLPLPEIPDLLRNLCVDLTLPRIYRRRFDAAAIPDTIKSGADAARAMLADIAAGRKKLPLSGKAAGGQAGHYRVNKGQQDQVFGPRTLRGLP